MLSKVTKLQIPQPDPTVDTQHFHMKSSSGFELGSLRNLVSRPPRGSLPPELFNTSSLTCPKFHSREFDKTHVWVSILASVWFDDGILYTVTLTKVKLLFIFFLFDHHNLLGVLVLLPDALQSPKGLVEVVSPMPSVPVFGEPAHHV